MSQVNSLLPLQLLRSGQLLALSANSQGGLLIQKPFFAEFAGPGAAVGGSFDVKCTFVYVLGTVEFQAPATYAERQEAFQQRMTYLQKLQEITSEEAPLSRARSIVNQLNQWCGIDEVNNIPNELIAQLIAVFPETVAIARQQRLQEQPARTEATQSL